MNNQKLNQAMTDGIMRVEQIIHIATQANNMNTSDDFERVFESASGPSWEDLCEEIGIDPKTDYWEPIDIFTSCKEVGRLGVVTKVAFPMPQFLKRPGFDFHHEEVYERWFYGETLEEAYQKAFEIHRNAVEHGWYDGEKRKVPELLCLVHSEVSEALEAYRNGDQDNFREELADVAIRLMDMSEYLSVDLEAEIARKHEINKGRPYRHGGKVC